LSGDHQREAGFLLARAEQRALQYLVARLPARTMPDHLTVIGIIGATMVGAGYVLSRRAEEWLLLACAGLAVNWFGDSLDGTLARYRRTERPRYGFYLDHLTDAYSTIAIGVGLGLSPYMLLAVGMAIVIAYLVLSINVYLETHAFGRFAAAYGRFGPTEARLMLLVLNLAALVFGPLGIVLYGIPFTVFDAAGLAIVAGMTMLLAGRIRGNLRALARLEPARRPADAERGHAERAVGE
jgi:phosphatidylglycerophosphate synthase